MESSKKKMIKLQVRIYSEFFGWFKMAIPEVSDYIAIKLIDNKKFNWLPGEKWGKQSSNGYG